MKEIDDLIISLENYMIEPISDLYLDDTVLEGANMDIEKLIRADEVKRARKLIQEAKKLRRKKEFDEAIKKLNESVKLISAMKKKVDGMPEPESRGSKILSYFTPLFTLMPSSQITGMKIIPTVHTGGQGGASLGYTIKIIRTEYTDKMSENTKSAVKKQLQLKFNLFLNNVEATIDNYKEERKYYLNKIKGKK